MRPGIYVTETVLPTPLPAFSSTAAAGAMIATLPSGPETPTLITSWYQFSRVFGPLDGSYDSTFAANLFFRSGGRELYVVRAVRPSAVAASVDVVSSSDDVWGTFTAKSPGAYGNNIRVEVAANSADRYTITIRQEAGDSSSTADDIILETYTNLDFGTFGALEVPNTINLRSSYVNFAWDAEGSSSLTLPSSIGVLPLTSGSDGTVSEDPDYLTALSRLAEIDRTFVVFAPDNTSTELTSAIVEFCEANKSFYVAETPADSTAAEAVSHAQAVGVSDHAAVYYPHLWVSDATSRSRSAVKKIGPSGSVAGMMLNTDASIGVFKAPAGTTATLPGTVALERQLTSSELDALNNDSYPVNAIRNLAGVGPVVMGARTLDQSTATKYVNIRRTMVFLDKELNSMLEFALFRNSGSDLWAEMRTVVSAYLENFWGNGGLRGATRENAFYVKIDSENNSIDDIQNGVVNVEIGVALQYPAEFIKIQLTQTTAA